jgi:hypothetical protein
VIQISRVRVVERVTVSPEIVWREGQYADYATNPVIDATAAEERAVAAIVLDHEQAHKETSGRDGKQQANPVTTAESNPH